MRSDQSSKDKLSANIGLDENMIWMFEKTLKIFKIARISELVEIYDETIGLLGKNQPYEIAAYKTRTACNKNLFHIVFKNLSSGFCHNSIGLSSKDCILSQQNLLLAGLAAAVLNSLVLQGISSVFIFSFSKTNFAI